MKIHIETLLQKVEELEKKYSLEMIQVDQRIKELLRDKVRLEELLNLRESDSEKIKGEN
jgi:cell shape-determining protein MreC